MAYSEERESKLMDYEEGVETWNTEVRPAFANLTITAYGLNRTLETEPFAPVEHELETIEEKLDHDGYGKLPDYQPLFFVGFDHAAVYGLDTVTHVNFTQTAEIWLRVDDRDQTDDILLPPMNLFRKRFRKGQHRMVCEDEGGTYDEVDHVCITLWQLDGFCVKI
jgi:hypothetical protein